MIFEKRLSQCQQNWDGDWSPHHLHCVGSSLPGNMLGVLRVLPSGIAGHLFRMARYFIGKTPKTRCAHFSSIGPSKRRSVFGQKPATKRTQRLPFKSVRSSFGVALMLLICDACNTCANSSMLILQQHDCCQYSAKAPVKLQGADSCLHRRSLSGVPRLELTITPLGIQEQHQNRLGAFCFLWQAYREALSNILHFEDLSDINISMTGTLDMTQEENSWKSH
jgi:hypothetical protein